MNYKKEDLESKVQNLKRKIKETKANEENIIPKWDAKWEKDAIKLFAEDYKGKLKSQKVVGIEKSEPIDGINRLTDGVIVNKKMKSDCDILYKLQFKWLKNVKGDGNCYYRAVMCGYFETLLSGGEELIENYAKMISKGNTYYTKESQTEIRATEKLMPILEKLIKVRKQLGVRKALHEYFLESISSDTINLV